MAPVGGAFGTTGEDSDGPIRVLHVDDESGFVEMAAEFLERESSRIRVETATSAEDALAALDDDVDCVVSDYDMPGTNGLELYERVTEQYPTVPFVLFTGKGSEEVASDAISMGVSDYLQKAPGSEQFTLLANRVENLVQRARAREDLRESQRRFSTLVRNLPGMVYRCRNEPSWPMEFVSSGCEALTGYEASKLLSGEVEWGRDVLLPEERDRLWRTVQEAVGEGEPFRVEYRIRRADGEIREVWEQGRGVDEDGELVALEGFITDITDRD